MLNLYILPLLGIITIKKEKEIENGIKVICLTLLIYVLIVESMNINSWFIIITVIIIPCSLITSWSNVKWNKSKYVIIILLLESILIKYFTTKNILIFYITFEISLIPLYLIIKIKLSNKVNISSYRSTNLLFMYTLVGSIIILVGILILIWVNNEIIYWLEMIKSNKNIVIWMLLFIGLSVKIPLVPFHVWLFRAHSEAPITVSIVLSSVILKIATFGYVKLVLENIISESIYIVPLIEILLIISLIYTSISASRQSDIKSLVAISSINHQSIVIIGIFSSITLIFTDNNKIGYIGILCISLGHGFVSPGLFLITGSILYDRYHSRTMYYYGSLNKWIPIFNVIILMLSLINLSIPLTLNFYGEIYSIIIIVKSNKIIGIISSTTIILSAIYSILLWSRLNYGSENKNLYFSFDMNRREFITLIIIVILVLVIGIIPNLIIIN